MEKRDKNLVVIIGRTSSGKSSVIEELGARGYNTLEEVARNVLKFRHWFEPGPTEVEKRQTLIYQTQLYFESLAEGLVFLERGLPCTFAFSEYLLGKVPQTFDSSLLPNRYSNVFVLESLPFCSDAFRVEANSAEADRIQETFEEFYSRFGYKPVLVPAISVKDRVDFILEKIGVGF